MFSRLLRSSLPYSSQLGSEGVDRARLSLMGVTILNKVSFHRFGLEPSK